MLEIDGSMGEGGGQVLRTSLTLSLVTGRAFRMTNIRANRSSPGLRPQHLTAVQAAAAISDAETDGAAKNSTELTFRPGSLRPGDYHFDIQTAGSSVLVLQTLLPSLATLDASSSVSVEGGTHNVNAPPFEYLDRVYRPILERLGADVDLELSDYGFYPAGGGRVRARLRSPLERRARLELRERGELKALRATSVVARLPEHIAERELDTLAQHLAPPLDAARQVSLDDTRSPGNYLYVEADSERLTELFSVIGRKGLRAETVGVRAARQVNAYLEAAAPVGQHLADQLLVPLAIAGGGVYRSGELTTHTTTQIRLVPRFLDVDIERSDVDGNVEVRVEPR